MMMKPTKKPLCRVLIDTNFLLVPSKFKIDIFEGLTNILSRRYTPILLSPTHKELLKIAEKGSPKIRRQASLALKLAEKCDVFPVKQGYEEAHDDVIVRVASEWRCPVATNDGALRKRLRNISVPVIYLRQTSRLEMEGSV